MFSSGEAKQAGVPQPVPLQRVLCICQAEGTGVQEHRVDCWVHCPKAPCQDRQLHPHILTFLLDTPPPPLSVSLSLFLSLTHTHTHDYCPSPLPELSHFSCILYLHQSCHTAYYILTLKKKSLLGINQEHWERRKNGWPICNLYVKNNVYLCVYWCIQND